MYGRVKYIDEAKWKSVQGEELKFWKTTAVPRGNLLQASTFDQFESLPRSLGRVLEIGAGPYTKTFLMLEVSASIDCVLAIVRALV